MPVLSRIRVSKSWIGGRVIRVTPEMERPAAIFWSDVQFLMIAVRHLDFSAEKLGRGAPRLDRTLKAQGGRTRQLLEHWWGARQKQVRGRAIARSTDLAQS